MMEPERRLSTGAISIVLCATLACSPPERDPATVVYASGTDLESANPLVTVHPFARQVQRHALFVTLVRHDSLLRVLPYWARRWTWTADRRTLTLSLEPALRWHDGQRATAHDAVFTLEAARDPATGFPRHADLAGLDDVAAVDDTTLQLRFAAAQPEVPTILAELPIVPAHVLRGVPHGDMRRAPFGTHPVGAGPFRFVDRAPGQRWSFERVPDFPASMGGAPAVRRFVVAVVDEPTTKFAGLVAGDLDAAGIAPTMAPLVRRDRRLRVIEYPVLFSTGVVFNGQRAPFDDVRVRRALSLSVDRARIVRAALAGFGVPASGPVPPDNPLALALRVAHDTARADSLLDAAGWRRGADGMRRRGGAVLAFTLATVGSGDNALEQLLQADFAARGIRMEIRQLEMGAFLTAARAPRKEFDALVAGIPGDLSLAYLAAMFDSPLAGGALDYAGYHTARLDARFARVRAAASAAALRDAWLDVQRELAAEVPVAWLYHARGVQGVSARLDGVRMDLRGELATLARWQPRAPR
jgi:peptide/nickel transport system substrate-binding protein